MNKFDKNHGLKPQKWSPRVVPPGGGGTTKVENPGTNSNVDQWESQVFRFPNENDLAIRCQVRICYEMADCVRDCKKSRSGGQLISGGKTVESGKTLEKTVSTGWIIIRARPTSGCEQSGC